MLRDLFTLLFGRGKSKNPRLHFICRNLEQIKYAVRVLSTDEQHLKGVLNKEIKYIAHYKGVFATVYLNFGDEFIVLAVDGENMEQAEYGFFELREIAQENLNNFYG